MATRTWNKAVAWGLGAVMLAALAIATAAPGAHAQERRRISLDDIVVEGNIQKPEAFFILPRTSLNFEDLERREDLKKRIIDSVEKAPF